MGGDMRVKSYDNLQILSHAMDASMLRHSILANNVTNISTPGFKRSDVSFQSELARALEPATRMQLNHSMPGHFDPGPERDASRVMPRAYAEIDTWARNDKNNVNPEVEMTNLAQNTLYYQTVTQFVSGNFKSLATIVQRSGSA